MHFLDWFDWLCLRMQAWLLEVCVFICGHFSLVLAGLIKSLVASSILPITARSVCAPNSTKPSLLLAVIWLLALTPTETPHSTAVLLMARSCAAVPSTPPTNSLTNTESLVVVMVSSRPLTTLTASLLLDRSFPPLAWCSLSLLCSSK